jgi:hypothetical protein
LLPHVREGDGKDEPVGITVPFAPDDERAIRRDLVAA